MELKNGRLQIKFGEISTQRFDRTAVVTEVVLDGKYAFCTPEQVLPRRRTTNGRGLCGEFVLPGAAEGAKAGEWFVKPGVGLLKQTQDGAGYDMWKSYECRPLEVMAEIGQAQAVFRQKEIVSGGYGVDIEKRFSLEENRLILDISVTNVGETSMELQEYQHNFVSIEGLPVSEGYILELPCDRTLPGIVENTLRQGDEIRLPSAVAVAGNSVCWKSDMTEKILYHSSEEIDPAAPRRWTLRHASSRVSITEEADFLPTRLDVWSVEHCVCAEFYNAVTLAPGEAARWRRTWTFVD